MKKRSVAVVCLVLCLALSIVGCGEKTEKTKADSTKEEEIPEGYQILDKVDEDGYICATDALSFGEDGIWYKYVMDPEYAIDPDSSVEEIDEDSDGPLEIWVFREGKLKICCNGVISDLFGYETHFYTWNELSQMTDDEIVKELEKNNMMSITFTTSTKDYVAYCEELIERLDKVIADLGENPHVHEDDFTNLPALKKTLENEKKLAESVDQPNAGEIEFDSDVKKWDDDIQTALLGIPYYDISWLAYAERFILELELADASEEVAGEKINEFIGRKEDGSVDLISYSHIYESELEYLGATVKDKGEDENNLTFTYDIKFDEVKHTELPIEVCELYLSMLSDSDVYKVNDSYYMGYGLDYFFHGDSRLVTRFPFDPMTKNPPVRFCLERNEEKEAQKE